MLYAVDFGKQNNFVVCGHVHYAEDSTYDGIRYINLGAWTESPCYCLLVDEENMKLTTIAAAMTDKDYFL